MGVQKAIAQSLADKRRSRRERVPTRSEWIDGFSIRLTENEKREIKADLEAEGVEMLAILLALADEGIKTSLAFDRKDSSYAITIFRNIPGYEDSGYSLTARGSSFERCFAALLYVLVEVRDFNILTITEARENLAADF